MIKNEKRAGSEKPNAHEMIKQINHKSKPAKIQSYQSIGRILEFTKLSNLRKRLSLVTTPSPTTVCAACEKPLNGFDTLGDALDVCRECVKTWARVDVRLEEKAQRDRRELLEKFVGGKNA